MTSPYAKQIRQTWRMQGLALLTIAGAIGIGWWSYSTGNWLIWPVNVAVVLAEIYILWQQARVRRVWRELENS